MVDIAVPNRAQVVSAPSSGVLTRLDAMAVGLAAFRRRDLETK